MELQSGTNLNSTWGFIKNNESRENLQALHTVQIYRKHQVNSLLLYM